MRLSLYHNRQFATVQARCLSASTHTDEVDSLLIATCSLLSSVLRRSAHILLNQLAKYFVQDVEILMSCLNVIF